VKLKQTILVFRSVNGVSMGHYPVTRVIRHFKALGARMAFIDGAYRAVTATAAGNLVCRYNVVARKKKSLCLHK